MSRQEIISLFDDWNQALKSLDAEKVTALYEKQALLMPTMSDKNRHCHSEIKDYFLDFLLNAPSAELNESSIKINETLAVHSGVYTFTFNKIPSLQARFTFVYQRCGHRWLISQHHSSLMP